MVTQSQTGTVSVSGFTQPRLGLAYGPLFYRAPQLTSCGLWALFSLDLVLILCAVFSFTLSLSHKTDAGFPQKFCSSWSVLP